MTIAVDAMGGDHAPSVVVRGSIAALQEGSDKLRIMLIGNEKLIKKELEKSGFSSSNLAIRHTSQVVEMTDRPSQVPKRKPDSSLVVGIRSIQQNESEAVVSAGSTGAILSASLLLLGPIEGVRRPALGVYFPVAPKGLVLCDAGANVEVKAQDLLQFAIMASEYMKHIQGVKTPTIGLLNIGVEPTKGHEVYVEAHRLMTANLPSFKGNIESRYLMDGLVDIVVCDGFVGNNLVNFAEGWIGHVNKEVSRQLKERVQSESERRMFNDIFSHVMREYEYEEYGGVPLLGVNGVCIICHGSSPARAIKNAILSAQKSVEENLVDSIREGISSTVSHMESTN